MLTMICSNAPRSNSSHVLQPYLPDKINHYQLRTRSHNRTHQ